MHRHSFVFGSVRYYPNSDDDVRMVLASFPAKFGNATGDRLRAWCQRCVRARCSTGVLVCLYYGTVVCLLRCYILRAVPRAVLPAVTGRTCRGGDVGKRCDRGELLARAAPLLALEWVPCRAAKDTDSLGDDDDDDDDAAADDDDDTRA